MWTNFLNESKQYMNYAKMTRREKLRFWRRFPVAAFKFYVSLPIRWRTTTLLWQVRHLWERAEE